ncbi:MAG: hypothetical protein UY63_C0015G0021 [Parcubacteria group bacterium GW2011_GWA2_51_10]|nr:MAG: hypothetical protein UY63_C0015G0021 [Parcubacteria group bacterium GW2011_GWA2_51_10]
MEYLFLLGRVLFGGFWIWGGINHFRQGTMMEQYVASKKVPSAKLAVYGTGVLLVVAGIGIVLGIYVPLAVLLIVVFLVPVTYRMHDFWNVTDPNTKMIETVMFAKNLALLGAALAFLFVPLPWSLSLLS